MSAMRKASGPKFTPRTPAPTSVGAPIKATVGLFVMCHVSLIVCFFIDIIRLT
ncbi:hypothetical protein AO377_1961 [Moraxella catarrhalis]|nr:hypothetical protein AO377_1961 [Moraxella catarrhalis]